MEQWTNIGKQPQPHSFFLSIHNISIKNIKKLLHFTESFDKNCIICTLLLFLFYVIRYGETARIEFVNYRKANSPQLLWKNFQKCYEHVSIKIFYWTIPIKKLLLRQQHLCDSCLYYTLRTNRALYSWKFYLRIWTHFYFLYKWKFTIPQFHWLIAWILQSHYQNHFSDNLRNHRISSSLLY